MKRIIFVVDRFKARLFKGTIEYYELMKGTGWKRRFEPTEIPTSMVQVVEAIKRLPEVQELLNS